MDISGSSVTDLIAKAKAWTGAEEFALVEWVEPEGFFGVLQNGTY